MWGEFSIDAVTQLPPRSGRSILYWGSCPRSHSWWPQKEASNPNSGEGSRRCWQRMKLRCGVSCGFIMCNPSNRGVKRIKGSLMVSHPGPPKRRPSSLVACPRSIHPFPSANGPHPGPSAAVPWHDASPSRSPARGRLGAFPGQQQGRGHSLQAARLPCTAAQCIGHTVSETQYNGVQHNQVH